MSDGQVDIALIAASIARRGLTVPAIFLLELHKPLSGIISEGILMSKPLLTILFGSASIETIHRISSSPDLTEELIAHLERREWA